MPDPATEAEPRRTARAEATRRRVLDSAGECLAELGPLGATSNEIARRAGVSWGVIQYHFGTREGILLAWIEDSLEVLLGALDGHEATEEATLDERIALVADAIWGYCSQPDYMLSMDVLRLLSHDPLSADAVDAMLRRTEQKLTRRMNRILRDVVPDDATLATVRSLIFATMRGLALKQSFARSRTTAARAAADERALLVRGLVRTLTDR